MHLAERENYDRGVREAPTGDGSGTRAALAHFADVAGAPDLSEADVSKVSSLDELAAMHTVLEIPDPPAVATPGRRSRGDGCGCRRGAVRAG
jgi:hypothetical protein